MNGLKPSGVLKVHHATREDMAFSITEKEIENKRLKKRIRELEEALTPNMLFVEPLAMMVIEEFPEEMTRSTSKVTKATKLLIGVKIYVVENIDKRIDIMHEAWEITVEDDVISKMIHSLKQYLQEDQWNDEKLYKNVVSTFMVRISIMDDLVK
jgi:hypothetical protein